MRAWHLKYYTIVCTFSDYAPATRASPTA